MIPMKSMMMVMDMLNVPLMVMVGMEPILPYRVMIAVMP